MLRSHKKIDPIITHIFCITMTELIEEMNNMIKTLPFLNDNIRANINFGIEIYLRLKNFKYNYIHEFINENSIEFNK